MYFDPISCGQRIKELRRLSGLTQEQLADSLHTSADHFGKIELGKRRCSLDLLIEIAEFFDVSMDYLILGKSRPNSIAKKRLWGIIGELTLIEREL